MKSFPWSPVEDEYLLDRYLDATWKSLSDDLRKSPTAVRRRLNDFGLAKPPKTRSVPRANKQCQNPLCGEYFPVKQVYADRRQYCSSACNGMAQSISFPEKSVLQPLYEQGMSANELAKKFEMSDSTMGKLLRRYGIEIRGIGEAFDIRPLKPSRYKSGPRSDLGEVSPRSGWEANFIRWLNYEKIDWVYEPRRFIFPTNKRGSKSYLPDLWLPSYDGGKWVEVKGALRSGNKSQTRRFREFYPDDFARLMVVPGSSKTEAGKFFESLGIPVLAYYHDLEKTHKKLIPLWES